MSREIVKSNGSLICPIGDGGRLGIRAKVSLVTVVDGSGEIERTFFRVRWDGHCVEATSREKLRQGVAAIGNDVKSSQWTKFVIPQLRHEVHSLNLPPYTRVVADQVMVDAFEPPIQGKSRGTRIRYLSDGGRYSNESQRALTEKGDGEYIPDTVATREAMADIQKELSAAVRKAERAVKALVKKTKGKVGDPYVGDK